MKATTALILAACILLVVEPANSQKNEDDLGLPELHKIKRATLSPSYSCRSREESRNGYAGTALFLSAYSKNHNSPELLFNGACNSQDFFQTATVAGDLDVVADYGDIPIESLTANHVFSPDRTMRTDVRFTRTAKVEHPRHTYGVLINKREVRGFFYFRVTAYVPNQSVELEYAVMEYQVLRMEARSAGFSWDRKSSR